MKKLINEYYKFLKERFSCGKAVFVIELIYVLFCLGSGIYFAILGRISNALMAFAFPLVVFAVCLFEWKANVRGGALFYAIFLFMSLSNVLGNGYELYVWLFPYFDKIMHTLSGVIFTCFGYMLMKMMLGGDEGKKFIYCLIFGLVFSMAIAALWEIYEYFVSEVLHLDMQANYSVNTVDYINYIASTTITYVDGTTLTVDGYIDVGLFDTLQDITVCLIGGLFATGVFVLDNKCFKRKINRLIIPKILPNESYGEAGLEKNSSEENLKTA